MSVEAATAESRFIAVYMPLAPERQTLGALRRKMCKMTRSTQALQAPVHISFIRTSRVADVPAWLGALRALCATQRSFTLRLRRQTTVRPDRFWAGISFYSSRAMKRLRHRVDRCTRAHVRPREFRAMLSPAHLTLTFPAKVEHIRTEALPVSTLRITCLTVLEQKERNGAYYVHSHLPFGGRP